MRKPPRGKERQTRANNHGDVMNIAKRRESFKSDWQAQRAKIFPEPALSRNRRLEANARFERYLEALQAELKAAEAMATDELEARLDAAKAVLLRRRWSA